MSDETTNQIKGFGRMVANEDRNITVETNVKSTLCTIDTLTLQVTFVDVPYKMLVHFKGTDFPVWPEPSDTQPSVYPDFVMWPNPTSGEFNIRVDESWGPLPTVEIFNVAGQLVWKQTMDGLQCTVSLTSLNSQLLHVRLTDPVHGHKATRRLLLRT